jgi:hypothetical protein
VLNPATLNLLNQIPLRHPPVLLPSQISSLTAQPDPDTGASRSAPTLTPRRQPSRPHVPPPVVRRWPPTPRAPGARHHPSPTSVPRRGPRLQLPEPNPNSPTLTPRPRPRRPSPTTTPHPRRWCPDPDPGAPIDRPRLRSISLSMSLPDHGSYGNA